MNFKLLLGVSVSVVVIIAVIAMYAVKDDSSFTEQEIQEFIQKEISKSPQITGIYAQTICKILDMDCSDQQSFYAVFDLTDGYTKLSYSQNGKQYDFRIIDDVLEYHTNHNSAEWMMYEEEDIWMWDYDAKARDETIPSASLTEQKYSKTFQFDSDELGNYGNWRVVQAEKK
ncbi:hypothetical protein [Nitrosopumilus ureiphilus]|uniref:Uncharacterized protein n=1 Tax=Nitrosopumilus ureiphilus TaxID=1470067 RepID=A0A7D5RAW7_9ARCH|nr:hypothetical protein [Nitrosopumilus ureiphilus]QLH06522.1 hypothetical protein C5F50_05120 [Nitrosopumilus ureiphilus]